MLETSLALSTAYLRIAGEKRDSQPKKRAKKMDKLADKSGGDDGTTA